MRLIFGILIGALLTAFVGYNTMMSKGGDMMFSDRISPYSYEETVEKLNQSFKDNKWNVMAVKDSNAGFVKKGKAPIGKLTNMKVCKGSIAYEMLKNDETKQFAAMMPCGVAIFEKDGQVHVSTMNLRLMKEMFEPNIKALMTTVADDIDKIMGVL